MRLGCTPARGSHRANERVSRLLGDRSELLLRAWTFAREEHGARHERRFAVVERERAFAERDEERVGAIAERFVEERRWIERGLAREPNDERRVDRFGADRDGERTEGARERPLRVVLGTTR